MKASQYRHRLPRAFACIVLALLLAVVPSVPAQSSTNASASASSASAPGSSSSTRNPDVITTTLLQTVTPTASDSRSASPVTTSLVLTLTLNSTQLGGSPTSANASSITFNNGTTIWANGSMTTNTTLNSTEIVQPYNGTQTTLPFDRRIDGAYGAAGALLVISGAFVGVLGGKHRWSSMAIVSGYSLLLITLVIVLAVGVEPTINTLSPNPPNATLRGLYCLACIVASIIGSGVGLYFFKYSRYWVCAMGGFAFAWFLLALKAGGTVGGSLLGRWLLLGGVSVLFFVISLLQYWHIHLLLISTAWIGATAFVLGLDCFTRAGLKEFYIYNLGFWDLFPSLNNYPYPLLTIMQVELGVLGALFVVGAAIQYKVLGALFSRMKQIQAQEQERKEREEAAKAEKHIQRHNAELAAWEEKHGKGTFPTDKGSYALSGTQTPVDHLPTLAKNALASSQSTTASGGGLNQHSRSMSPFSSEGQAGTTRPPSPPMTEGLLPKLELGEGIVPSLMPNDEAKLFSPADRAALQEKEKLLAEIQQVKKNIEVLRSGTPTSSPITGVRQSRTSSSLSMRSADILDRQPSDRDWQSYLEERKLYTPPAGLTPPIPAATVSSANGRLSRVSPNVVDAWKQRERTLSAFEFGGIAESGQSFSQTGDLRRNHSSQSLGSRMMSSAEPRNSYFDAGPSYHAAPQIIGHADSPIFRSEERRGSRSASPRDYTVSFEELASRHRQRMSQLQRNVNDQLDREARNPQERSEQKSSADGKLRSQRQASDPKIRSTQEKHGNSRVNEPVRKRVSSHGVEELASPPKQSRGDTRRQSRTDMTGSSSQRRSSYNPLIN